MDTDRPRHWRLKRSVLLTSMGLLALALLLGVWQWSDGTDDERGHTGTDRSSPRHVGAKIGNTAAPIAGRVARPDHVVALQREVTELNEVLEARRTAHEVRCMTTAGDRSCPTLSPSSEMLKGMARCAVVRLDMPDLAAALEGRLGRTRLSPEEREAVQSAARVYSDRLIRELRELHRTAGGSEPPTEGDADAWLNAVEALVSSDPEAGDKVLRAIARERAGMVAPPGPESSTAQTPSEKFWRLRANIGDEFEREVARELGAARARELREANDGWALQNSYAGECRD